MSELRSGRVRRGGRALAVLLAASALLMAWASADYDVGKGVDALGGDASLVRCPSGVTSGVQCNVMFPSRTSAYLPADGSRPLFIPVKVQEAGPLSALKVLATIEGGKGALERTTLRAAVCRDEKDLSSCCDLGTFDMDCSLLTSDQCSAVEKEFKDYNLTGSCTLFAGESRVMLAAVSSAHAVIVDEVRLYRRLTPEQVEAMRPQWVPTLTEFALAFAAVIAIIALVLLRMGVVKLRRGASVCAVCSKPKEGLFECPQCHLVVCSECFVNDGTHYCCKNCISFSGDYQYDTCLDSTMEMKAKTGGSATIQDLVSKAAPDLVEQEKARQEQSGELQF